ncbi:MAG: hypothetical protein KDD51_04465 [Bdellovibrionales bacterium]|nr:hypothetical protein [Bdellovibrionales bacterium]
MKYLIWTLLTIFLVSCASTPKSGETADTTQAKDAEKTAQKAEDATKKGASPSAAGVECKWETETRKIENKTQGEGCEVIYTKNGTSETVGSATNDLSICEGIAKRIQGNLENNGFKCNAI